MVRKQTIFLFICITLIILICFPKIVVRAQEMSSQNYKLQGGNFNMTSGNKASSNYKLSDVVGQTAANVFASKGYIIQSGFLNGAAGEVFSFSVTPNTVDFGYLYPNVPVERSVNLRISNGNVPGYNVKAVENQPLSTSVQAEITDTICDPPPAGPCSYNSARMWNLNTAYGFGYKMAGMTTPKDFDKSGFFRPFAATKRNEKPITVMQSKAKKVVDTATMTLRLNIGPNQPVGQYRNVISFTAIAGI